MPWGRRGALSARLQLSRCPGGGPACPARVSDEEVRSSGKRRGATKKARRSSRLACSLMVGGEGFEPPILCL